MENTEAGAYSCGLRRGSSVHTRVLLKGGKGRESLHFGWLVGGHNNSIHKGVGWGGGQLMSSLGNSCGGRQFHGFHCWWPFADPPWKKTSLGEFSFSHLDFGFDQYIFVYFLFSWFAGYSAGSSTKIVLISEVLKIIITNDAAYCSMFVFLKQYCVVSMR